MSKCRNAIRVAKSLCNPIYYNGKIIRKPPHSSVLSRIAVSPEKKFVYLRIPKAANSTVTALLWNQLHQEIYDSKTPTKKIKKSFLTALDLNITQSKQAKEEYFFFTIVRNPFDRVLSAYLQKFKSDIYRRRYGKDISKAGNGDINFHSFCKFLAIKGVNKDPHWIPQHKFIWPNLSRIDYVGKFENLHNDLINIFNRLFHNYTIDLNTYYGPGRTNASELRASYYNKESKDIIYNIYIKDFELFKYRYGD